VAQIIVLHYPKNRGKRRRFINLRKGAVFAHPPLMRWMHPWDRIAVLRVGAGKKRLIQPVG
ncbi:MAG: hypothetical protein O7F14_11180, partial [Alphaproteobacteria bacterium]|nr:hypothetical protein [Alphaproteobacteria bacterium]